MRDAAVQMGHIIMVSDIITRRDKVNKWFRNKSTPPRLWVSNDVSHTMSSKCIISLAFPKPTLLSAVRQYDATF